jgi:nucleoid DNA-binding protein
LVQLGSADDRSGDDRLGQQPRQCHRGQAVKTVVNAILDALVAGEAVRVPGLGSCDVGGATCTRGAESTNRRGHPNRSQQGSAVSRGKAVKDALNPPTAKAAPRKKAAPQKKSAARK